MTRNRHLGNTLIFIVECMALRDCFVASKCNDILNLEIEVDSKVVIDCKNRKSSIPSSFILLMDDIWKLSRDLNIYKCCHIYWKANRTTDCLAKQCICNIDS